MMLEDLLEHRPAGLVSQMSASTQIRAGYQTCDKKHDLFIFFPKMTLVTPSKETLLHNVRKTLSILCRLLTNRVVKK